MSCVVSQDHFYILVGMIPEMNHYPERYCLEDLLSAGRLQPLIMSLEGSLPYWVTNGRVPAEILIRPGLYIVHIQVSTVLDSTRMKQLKTLKFMGILITLLEENSYIAVLTKNLKFTMSCCTTKCRHIFYIFLRKK